MAQFLLTHRGTITGVEDEFSHSLVVSGDGTVQEAAETARDIWRDDILPAPDGLLPLTANMVTYTEVTAASILSLATGELSAAYHAPMGAGYGGVGSTSLPPQIACCVSLTAGTRPNGQPLKGRFYLPTVDVAALDASTGLFDSGYRGAVADAISLYVTSLRTAGLDPGVWSRTTAIFQPLTQLRVGDQPDVIRSRRNAIPETYTSRNL